MGPAVVVVVVVVVVHTIGGGWSRHRLSYRSTADGAVGAMGLAVFCHR